MEGLTVLCNPSHSVKEASDGCVPVWTGWPVTRLWPAAAGYWAGRGAGSTRPGSRRWWSGFPGTEAGPGPPRPRSPADSPAPSSEPEGSGRPPSPGELRPLMNPKGRGVETVSETGRMWKPNNSINECNKAYLMCYRGCSAGLWVAAGLGAGVFTQTVTLVSQRGFLTAGGPDCALHLVLHVPVAALCTERKGQRGRLKVEWF